MAANRPVLGIGPIPSDMESLFEVHQLGVYTRFEDKERIKSTLLHWFTSDSIPFQSNQIDQDQRKEIAEKYANLILKDS